MTDTSHPIKNNIIVPSIILHVDKVARYNLHSNYYCTADSESAGDYFFSRAKHIMGHFEGFFEGAETFLTPKLF